MQTISPAQLNELLQALFIVSALGAMTGSIVCACLSSIVQFLARPSKKPWTAAQLLSTASMLRKRASALENRAQTRSGT